VFCASDEKLDVDGSGNSTMKNVDDDDDDDDDGKPVDDEETNTDGSAYTTTKGEDHGLSLAVCFFITIMFNHVYFKRMLHTL